MYFKDGVSNKSHTGCLGCFGREGRLAPLGLNTVTNRPGLKRVERGSEIKWMKRGEIYEELFFKKVILNKV